MVISARTMRALVADFAPPIMLRQAQQLWHRARGLGSHTFEGCYPDLSAVPCGDGKYDDDELAVKIAAILENLKTPRPREKVIDNQGGLFLPLIASQYFGRPLTVLDFGGGPCTGLRAIADHAVNLDVAEFTYILVETPALCRALRGKIDDIATARFGSASFIEILEDIPSVISGDLIVHASSSLQYVSAYPAVLARLAGLAPGRSSWRGRRLATLPLMRASN